MPAAAVIALVDDDPSVRRALGRLLASSGFAVRAFSSGSELIESGFAPDAACLLVDVHLIGMSGFELVEELRERGVKSSAIFMTAHDSEQTRIQACAIESSAYLRKPFEASLLIEAVRSAIDSSSD